MSEFLLIHYKPGSNNSARNSLELNETEQNASLHYWVMGADQQPSISLGHGNLDELKTIARGKNVTLLIDAHYTTSESVNIPSNSRSKQLLAIPFAMEDSLAEDIEDTHFSLGKSEADGIPVIAIKRNLLQQIISQFAQQQIHIDVITSDSSALTGSSKNWSVLLDEDSALIKSGPSQAHSCDRENLAVILQSLLLTHEEQQLSPDSITYYFKEADALAATLLDDIDVEVDSQPYKNHALEIFVQNRRNLTSLNLLQGEFTPVREGNLWLKPWKSVAAIAGVWLALQLGYDSMLASQLQQENITLTRQIETEFKRAIPDARKMTNMQKRVERRLNDLKSGGSGSSNGFLQILSKVSPTLSNNDKIEIQAAVYRNNYIDVDLTARSLQDIESIKDKLSSIPGLKIVLSTTVEKESVKGRLRLETKG